MSGLLIFGLFLIIAFTFWLGMLCERAGQDTVSEALKRINR